MTETISPTLQQEPGQCLWSAPVDVVRRKQAPVLYYVCARVHDSFIDNRLGAITTTCSADSLDVSSICKESVGQTNSRRTQVQPEPMVGGDMGKSMKKLSKNNPETFNTCANPHVAPCPTGVNAWRHQTVTDAPDPSAPEAARRKGVT